MRLSILAFSLSLFLTLPLLAQNTIPTIEITGSNMDGSGLTLDYKVQDVENQPLEIRLLFSLDEGKSFREAKAVDVTLDYGFPILSGDRRLLWNWADSYADGPSILVRLVADDRQSIDVSSMITEINADSLEQQLQVINGPRHRTTGPAKLKMTGDKTAELFTELGYEVRIHEFPFGSYTARNIIGVKHGTKTDTSIIIVDGHYDTVSNAPGADDNGSAVVGMWAIAKAMKDIPTEKTVYFIAFDLEEDGLVGSSRFLQSYKQPYEKIEGVLNMEMIGYYSEAINSQTLPAGFEILYPDVFNSIAQDTFKGNFITNVSGTTDSPLRNAFINAAQQYVPDLKVQSIAVPSSWQVLTPDLGRSDHAPFWVAGIPALMLTDGANFRNQNYHTINDDISTINFDFMENVTEAVGVTAAQLAIPSSSSFDERFYVQMAAKEQQKKLRFSILPSMVGDEGITVQVPEWAANGRYLLKNIAATNSDAKYIALKGVELLQIPTHELPTGTYIFTLVKGKMLASEKFVVVR